MDRRLASAAAALLVSAAGLFLAPGAGAVTTTVVDRVALISTSIRISSEGSASCASPRRFVIHPQLPPGQRLVDVTVKVNGKPFRNVTLHRLTSAIVVVGAPQGSDRLSVVGITNVGTVMRASRAYHSCLAPKRHTISRS